MAGIHKKKINNPVLHETKNGSGNKTYKHYRPRADNASSFVTDKSRKCRR